MCLLFYCSIPDHYEPRNYLLPKKQTTISPHLRIVKFCANERTLQNFSGQIEVLPSMHWKRFKTCEVSVETHKLAKTWQVLTFEIRRDQYSLAKSRRVFQWRSTDQGLKFVPCCSLLFAVVPDQIIAFLRMVFYLLNFVVLRVFQTKNDIHFYRLIGPNWYQFSLFAYGVMWFCGVCRWSQPILMLLLSSCFLKQSSQVEVWTQIELWSEPVERTPVCSQSEITGSFRKFERTTVWTMFWR